MPEYTGYAPGGGTMIVSFRTKLGELIDSSWHHSWHWPEYNFEEVAAESLRSEYGYALKRLNELREAADMLRSRGIKIADPCPRQ